MNLPLRYTSLLLHGSLIALFCLYLGRPQYPLFTIILLQILLVRGDSSCYQGHCHPQQDLEECSMCGMKSWVRMRH